MSTLSYTLEPGDEELIAECIKIMRRDRKASTSLFQRSLRLGYTKASNILTIMEARGYVGAGDGAKPREIFWHALPDPSGAIRLVPRKFVGDVYAWADQVTARLVVDGKVPKQNALIILTALREDMRTQDARFAEQLIPAETEKAEVPS